MALDAWESVSGLKKEKSSHRHGLNDGDRRDKALINMIRFVMSTVYEQDNCYP